MKILRLPRETPMQEWLGIPFFHGRTQGREVLDSEISREQMNLPQQFVPIKTAATVPPQANGNGNPDPSEALTWAASKIPRERMLGATTGPQVP